MRELYMSKALEPVVPIGRRIVCGFDHAGRSTVVEDAFTPSRAIRPSGALLEELWRQDVIPADPDYDGRRGNYAESAPPPHGVAVRYYSLPPDALVNEMTAGHSLEEIYGPGSVPNDSKIPGMHRTRTIDVTTVVRGTVVVVLEDGEAVLEAGSTIIFTGQLHAWRNRTDNVAVLLSTCMPLRPEETDGVGQ
jgi:mannose-6-phosphate isomerase-like protein (cupin superfamily)